MGVGDTFDVQVTFDDEGRMILDGTPEFHQRFTRILKNGGVPPIPIPLEKCPDLCECQVEWQGMRERIRDAVVFELRIQNKNRGPQ